MADEQPGNSPDQRWPRSSRRREGPGGELAYKPGPYPAGPYPYGYQAPADQPARGRFSLSFAVYLIAAAFIGAAIAFVVISAGAALLS